MRSPRLVAAAFVAWFCSAGAASAWGDLGHVAVALAAERLLDPEVRTKVADMLREADDRLPPDMASKAVWADKYRDGGRAAGASTGTEKWHYVNLRIGAPDLDGACYGRRPLPPGTPASEGPAESCVVDKIEQFAAELASERTPPAERVLALKYLLHFVADVHQPLHAADAGDRGGNEVYVVLGGRIAPIKLHAYWDTEIVRFIGGTPDAVADKLARVYAGRWASLAGGTPKDWAFESYGVAKSAAYALDYRQGDARSGRMVYTIGQDYERAAMAAARDQMAKAAARLAALLNGALARR